MIFTRKQEKTIRKAWSTVEVLVQSSNDQGRRLANCLRVSMKYYGPVAGRYHLLSEIGNGLRNDRVAASVCCEGDERVLAYMVGVWLESRGKAHGTDLLKELEEARIAYRDAQLAYLEGK